MRAKISQALRRGGNPLRRKGMGLTNVEKSGEALIPTPPTHVRVRAVTSFDSWRAIPTSFPWPDNGLTTSRGVI
jgi:hypothetical protein